MKNISLAFAFILSSSAYASATRYFDLNLSNPRHLEDMTFSLYTLCGKNVTCQGVKLTIPTGSRVAVKSHGGAVCTIQRAAALQFKGGDTYVVTTSLKNHNQACVLAIKPKNSKTVFVELVNESAAL